MAHTTQFFPRLEMGCPQETDFFVRLGHGVADLTARSGRNSPSPNLFGAPMSGMQVFCFR
ncbi:hypothetical protein P3T25_009456 [Paraburkholderia sp. GAS32]